MKNTQLVKLQTPDTISSYEVDEKFQGTASS
jgi:hypothetical protein